MADTPPERSTRAIMVGTRPPLWLLMLFATMSPFSLLLFFPALPPLAEELGIGLGSVQWIITGFLIGVGTMQLVIGPLADRLGRRRIVLTGLIFYILTSAVAAAVSDVYSLIGLRIAQAICVASLSVVSRATVRDVFAGTDAARAMSFVTLALQLPGLLAPAIGGLLVVYAGWQSLFLLLTTIAVILLVLAYRFLPETRPDARTVPPALSRVFSDYTRLARNPQFSTNAGIIALTAAAAMTLLTVFPAALTDLFGKSPDVVGYYTSAYSVISLLGAFAAAQLVVRFGVGRLMASVLGATAIYLAGYLIWSQVLSFTLTNLFISVSVVGFGQSIIVSMGFARAVGADDELRGTASGFAGAFASIVSAGIAAVGATVYSFGLSKSLAVVFCCFLLSSSICGVLAWRDRRAAPTADKS